MKTLRFPTFRLLSRWLLPGQFTWEMRKSLLRLILLATEENIPLAPLIATWAADEVGAQKFHVQYLADLLEQGTPLVVAVEEARGALSDEDVLAIRFGTESGTLAASLRDRLEEPNPKGSNRYDRLKRECAQIFALIVVAFFVVSFLQIKIAPELEKVLSEFSQPQPASMVLSRSITSFIVQYWYLFALAAIASYWILVSSLPGRRARRAILGRLFQSLRELTTADVLQKLSIAAQAGRPIAGAISTLARYHFDPLLRSQLLFIRNEMEHGADVWQSMASLGLLSPPEVRVLTTAERVGNRPWALRQIALLKKQRTSRSLSRAAKLVPPLVIVLIGGFVLIQALEVFETLIQLINALL